MQRFSVASWSHLTRVVFSPMTRDLAFDIVGNLRLKKQYMFFLYTVSGWDCQRSTIVLEISFFIINYKLQELENDGTRLATAKRACSEHVVGAVCRVHRGRKQMGACSPLCTSLPYKRTWVYMFSSRRCHWGDVRGDWPRRECIVHRQLSSWPRR